MSAFIPFKGIDHEMITKELSVIQHSMFSQIANGMKNLDPLLAVITVQPQPTQELPSETERAQQIQAAWQTLDHLDTNINLQYADVLVCTAISLRSLVDMWSWFDKQCSQPAMRLSKLSIENLLEYKRPLPNSWIHSLVQDVRLQLLQKSRPKVELVAQKYFSLLDAPLYQGERRKIATQQVEETLRHVEGAVILWLKFPAESEARRETSQGIATFISVVHSALKNYNFLYLHQIQRCIKSLRSNLTDQKIRLSLIPWQQLSTELSYHPLAQEQSKEALALHLLVEHLQTVTNRPSQSTPQMLMDYQQALQTGGELGVDQFTQSLSKIHPQLTLPNHPPPSPVSDEEITRFCSFLRVAFAVARTPSPHPSPVQEKIIAQPDRYLPFRQLAPSKVVILEDPQGPFSPNRLKTREGFFDAVIFRLITQASDLLVKQRQVCFGSATEFFSVTEGLEETSYNVRNATGQYDRSKNIPHIQDYCDQANSWEQFINTPGLTLISLFKWLTGKSQGEKRFAGMGNLVGWLLASDYAYAGLVPVPTVSDLGYVINTLNLGAKRGLQLLKLPATCEEECVESIELVWNGIQEFFTPDEIDDMGLDFITLEHALCKYKRLSKTVSQVGFALYMSCLKRWYLTYFLYGKKDKTL